MRARLSCRCVSHQCRPNGVIGAFILKRKLKFLGYFLYCSISHQHQTTLCELTTSKFLNELLKRFKLEHMINTGSADSRRDTPVGTIFEHKFVHFCYGCRLTAPTLGCSVKILCSEKLVFRQGVTSTVSSACERQVAVLYDLNFFTYSFEKVNVSATKLIVCLQRLNWIKANTCWRQSVQVDIIDVTAN